MQRAARGAWIAGWLACWLPVAVAHAQPDADAGGGTAPALRGGASSAADAPPAETEASAASCALFLVPDLDAETQARLRDALLAQFALLDVRLVLEPAPERDQGAADRMGEMQARAATYHALAAFSIDEHSDGRWFVYLLDVERERLLVRPLDASAGQRGSAIEAVALMARESTRALLEGAPLPEPPVATAVPPEPSAPPTPPAEPNTPPEHKSGLPPIRGTHSNTGFRLSLAYTGSDFAEEVPARHAGAAGVGWLGLAPWYAALSVELAPPIALEDPVAFQVLRVPLRLHAGHRYQQGLVVFDLELVVTTELLRRSSDRNQPAGSGVRIDADDESRTDWLIGLGPRARVELLLFSWAGLAAELGFDTLLNSKNFKYLADTPTGKQTLLQPRSIRPIWSLGVAFYP